MRNSFRCFIAILGLGLAILALAAPTALAQYESVPPKMITGPLSHPRYEEGGFYYAMQFFYFSTNRTLKGQSIAFRGFLDNTGNITGTPNTYVGNKEEALNTDQLRGPYSYRPGWDLILGWRFENGIAVSFTWKHMVQAKYHAVAHLMPPNFNVGNALENTFLFSPVSNFGVDWAGAPENIPGQIGDTYGIWNAAEQMEIDLVQRFDIYSVSVRLPIWQTQDTRSYALIGPRIVWIWDNFHWRSVDVDATTGTAGGDTIARYSNMVSNRMYGVHFGCGNDWWLGNTPIGGFACVLEGEAGFHFNAVKANAGYERGDRSVSSKRARRLSSLVPSIEGRANLMWYPWEAISLSIGYDVMMFFNTIHSPQPVDFNLGNVNPEYSHNFMRWFYGMTIGISFVF